MADKGKDAGVAAIKGITQAITDYSKIQGERTKIQGQMLSNKIRLNQNWLYRMKAKKADEEMKKKALLEGGQWGMGEGGQIKAPLGKMTATQGLYNALKRKQTERPGSFTRQDQEKLTGLEGKIYGRDASPYTAQWKQKDAQKTLFQSWLQDLYPKASRGEKEPGEKWTSYAGPMTSKGEVVRRLFAGKPVDVKSGGKTDAAATLRRLGLTIDDFYKWATENQPSLARTAFPSKTLVK